MQTRVVARQRVLPSFVAGAAALLIACSGGTETDAPSADSTPAATATATASPADAVPPTPSAAELTRADAQVADHLVSAFPQLRAEQRSIELRELTVALPPDAIPAIDRPQFDHVEAVAEWLGDDEPVIVLEIEGDARAYPLQILTWHEIVNDEVGGVPVAVTFCPLCNTAIVFDRRVDGEVRDFGTSGMLRRNDLVMYDRPRQSLWQQITGEAIVGGDVGTRLTFLPAAIVSFAEFRSQFPDGLVLNRETGFVRNYGVNPYVGYDSVGSSTLFPIDEFDDGRLDAKERVLTVEVAGEPVAFPFSALSQEVVIETEVGGEPVVAFWQPGARSALDQEFIIGSRNVGSAAAYRPVLDGERLRFVERDGQIVDEGTGSVWNVLGAAVEGPLAGSQLEPVISANHFWFSWAVFQPETRVVTGAGE